MSYTKTLELLKKGNKLIDVTVELIKSAAKDLDSVQTIQLTIQHENLKKEIDLECGNFSVEDIIGNL